MWRLFKSHARPNFVEKNSVVMVLTKTRCDCAADMWIMRHLITMHVVKMIQWPTYQPNSPHHVLVGIVLTQFFFQFYTPMINFRYVKRLEK